MTTDGAKRPRSPDVPRHIVIASAVLLVLALATSQDLFAAFIFFYFAFGLTFCVQLIVAKLLARYTLKPALMNALLLLPAVSLAVLIGLTFNARAEEKSNLKTALGTKPPADMTDLHVFSSQFTDYVVFAFFRCSPESIRDLVSRPIYQRRERPSQYDFSKRDDWKDLQYLGLVTNLTVYVRTNLSSHASGELRVDPDGRFVLVGYGCD